MKLFTKDIDKKLFAQFPKGGELANQKVIAKIFNPYGRGVWYIINSDPNDPDYLWAIVNLFEVEVGSVSRKELESLRIKPFMLPLERDLSFSERNALEVYEGASKGQRFSNGGGIGFLPMELEEKINNIARWGGASMKEVIEYLNAMIDSGVTDEDLKPNPTKRTSFQVERAIDQKTKEIWKRIEPNYKGSLTGNRYYSIIRKMVETTNYNPTFLAQYKPFRKLQKDSYAEGGQTDSKFSVWVRKGASDDEEVVQRNLTKRQAVTLMDKLFEGNNYYEVGMSDMMAKGGEVDKSTAMVLSQNKAIAHHTEELKRALKKDPNVEPWVIGKVGRAETDISDVAHYLDGRSEYARGGVMKKRKMTLYESKLMAEKGKRVLVSHDAQQFYTIEEGVLYKTDDDLNHQKKFDMDKIDLTIKPMESYGGKYKKGGLTFDEKVKAVEKSLMSREVPKKYRNSYGKTFNKAEAHESAQKIIGAQLKKYNKK